MSLNYDFKVKTNLSPKEMLKIAAKVHKTEINEQYDSFRILGAGVGAINYTPEIVTEWGVNRYLESYGFFPNVDVHFSQSLKDKFEISQRNIAKSVAELFKKTKDRAVFLFNDDKTIAQRLNGDLIEI
ncbi:MAG: SitI3 family protein, partial [Pyrinomonadaceae bacterium]